MRKIYLAILLFIWTGIVFAQGQKVVLQNANETINLAAKTKVLIDSLGEWTALEASKKFDESRDFSMPPKNVLDQLDDVSNVYWLEIEIENNSDQQFWMIEIPFSKVPFVTWFENQNGQWIGKKDGFEIKMSERPLNNRFPAHLIQLETGESTKIILRVWEYNLTLPLHIKSLPNYQKHHRWADLIFGIFIDVLAAMVFLFVYFYYLYKNKGFLIFTGYVITMALFIPSFEGYLGTFPFALFTYVMAVWFPLEFFDLKSKHPKTYSVFKKSLWVLVAITLVAIILRIDKDHFYVPIIVQSTYLFFVGPAILYLGVRAILDRESWAKLYLIGLLMQFLGGAMEIATINLGWSRPLISFVTVGIFLEMSIFAFALFRKSLERDRALKQEKLEAQKQALFHAQENEKILREQTQILEQKVAERTEELEQKAKELGLSNSQLEEINREKDYLMSVIGHDIRSPFMGVVGFAEMLRDDIDDLNAEEVKVFTDKIYRNAAQVYDLFQNLLEWSKLDLDENSVRLELINISELVESLHEMFLLNMINKSVSFHREIDQNLEIETDRNMLSTVLRNFISNAVKYTPRGKSIYVSARYTGEMIDICVRDEGVGMDDKTLERLFKIGHNRSVAGTEQESGTGLGLLVSQKYASKYGGEIYVQSTVGKGSSFGIILPQMISSDKESIAQ